MSNNHHIFTHNDLDGALSLLTFRWFHPQDEITFQSVSNLDVDVKLHNFFSHSINSKNVYVMDISLRESLVPFDNKNLTIIDHHKRSEDHISKFKKSKIIYKDYTSNCKLLYKFLEKTNPLVLNDKQKTLILYGDDYDSSSHKFQDAYDLNILYWLEYKNDLLQFINDYRDGWVPFTKTQRKNINEIKVEAVKTYERYPLFSGKLFIQNKELNCIATFGTKPNMISIDILMKEKSPDIFFYVNTEKEKIIIRQNKSENMIDLPLFAQKYCNGNGNVLTAGGKPTELFMELTKGLKPL